MEGAIDAIFRSTPEEMSVCSESILETSSTYDCHLGTAFLYVSVSANYATEVRSTHELPPGAA